MDQLLSPQEAADRLGTSLRFVRRLVFERRIPFTKVGRHVRIAASDVDAFIAAGRIEARTAPGAPKRRMHDRCRRSNTVRTDPSLTGPATGGRTASCTAAASPTRTTPNAG